MTPELTTLGKVLGDDRYQNAVHCFLYLPMEEVWRLETRCMVLDQSDVDGIPEVVKRHGLSFALEIPTVRDIVANAIQQRPNVSLEQLLQAFLFYYDHDAFIAFDE